MPLYRATGNLVIRPCDTCFALVLHEEGEAADAELAGEEAQPVRWRAFPHHAPGGPACIGGGSTRVPPAPRKVVRTPTAARQIRAPRGEHAID